MAVGEGSLAAGEVARDGPVAARGEGKGWGRGGEEGAEEEGGARPGELREMWGSCELSEEEGDRPNVSAGAPAPNVSLFLLKLQYFGSEG